MNQAPPNKGVIVALLFVVFAIVIFLTYDHMPHFPTPVPASNQPPPDMKNAVKTPSGLQYVDVKVGTGASPQSGQSVTVHYVGTLTDGSQFDSSRAKNQPFTFTIGKGQVIKGWDEGVMTMKVGGIRKLVVPPTLGYGDQGTPGGPIPPNATLNFEVELLSIP